MFCILLISCQEKVMLKLGNDYNLDYDLNHYRAVFHNENEGLDGRGQYLDGDILEFNYDSTFVIALIKPVDKINESKAGRKVNNYYDRERLIKASLMREYWILNKKIKQELIMNKYGYSNSNVYGPFNKQEFELKRKELGVSDSLKLLPSWCERVYLQSLVRASRSFQQTQAIKKLLFY